jgi:hypothetical protein
MTSLAAWLLSAVLALAPVVVPPDANVAWDYQIGGARTPPAGVGIVDRDRAASPSGLYDICYVNAFQTQPDERSFWRKQHRSRLLLRHNGSLVVDGQWNEILLDVGTSTKRHRLTRIVGRWIDGCAAAGFDAVELDNLDSWTRSRHELRRRDARTFATSLVAVAHADGLAVAQKNAAELLGSKDAIGFDFAIVEECAKYHECREFVDAYSGRALLVEYRQKWFDAACTRVGAEVAVVLRNRNVTPGGPYETC